jgi:glucose-6-phosphate dehydrogenase assembly protein OpcA
MDTIHPVGPVVTDLPHVESALLHLWQTVDQDLHFITANLLVITQPRHLERVRSVLNEVGAAYTGRQVILVVGEPDRSLQVALVAAERGSFIERIEAPARLEQLPSLAALLLRPATLNHLWWASDEAPPPAVLKALARSADQLIIDSRLLPEGAAAPCLLADLAWARTARWRELSAQFFGDPLAARRLHELGHVTIEYAGEVARPAAYFAAWLADALGWPDLSRVTQRRITQRQVTQRRVSPVRKSDDLSSETLSPVALSGPTARFQLHACGPLLHGDIHKDGHEDGRDRIFEVRLPPLSLAEGLSTLLRSPVRDEAFVRASALLRRERADCLPLRSGGSTRPAPAQPLQTG